MPDKLPLTPSPSTRQLLFGVDFTSRPGRGKQITVAQGDLTDAGVRLDSTSRLDSFAAFEAMLATPGPWTGGFDFPFGLPREFVEQQGWPTCWPDLIRHYASHGRSDLTSLFRNFCNARPAGNKFAHRAVDRLARSSPSMKWINPPVAWMLLEGAPRLLAAGVSLPGLHAGDPARIALEAYPALLARQIIGNASYKNDDPAKQTPARAEHRLAIVNALCGDVPPLGQKLLLTHSQRTAIIDDASGDLLDAVLCLLQAAWAATQVTYGLPAQIDPVEGWIITVPAASV
ncbi:DUF429 domain-containing protein [Chitinimonas sp. BJYL2]|uniref:DUF429 domain-containing protein n=1 Tax=Chitinimonas sp. BJYL2 TaxID=2976696 RepID=UPI0022B32BD6|nr:DUF429 domain-containing protein [Chitinimonas sp. BJYL2]